MASADEQRRETSSLRATAHPVRLQILSLLTGAEMSAAETAGFADSAEDAARYVDAMAQELVRRFARRERPGSLTDAELWVAPEVFERVRSMVHEAATLLHAEARPPRTDGTVPVAMTAAVFRLSPEAKTARAKPRSRR